MIYCISDIHGHYDKYKALLEAISLKDSDTLYILGDIIDRGPDGIDILRDMALRPNVIPILGNHEFMMAHCKWVLEEITDESLAHLDATRLAAYQDWMNNGGGPTLRGLRALTREEREDIWDYLSEFALYAEVSVSGRDFVLVHSGLTNFAPDKPLEEYELDDFLFGRPAPESVYWPDKTLIFGHTPTRILWETPRDDIFYGKGFIDIDCGCGFDGRLGCLCLDSMEEIYV